MTRFCTARACSTELELRQSGDCRCFPDGACKEAYGSHVPEVNVGIEHLLDLPFDLATDEDESAGGKMVVRRLDENGVDELYGEDWVGNEIEEVGVRGGGVWEGRRIGAMAEGEEGNGVAGIWRNLMIMNLKLVQKFVLGYVLACGCECGCGCGYGCLKCWRGRRRVWQG